jgi:hypothetical protein
VPSSDKIVVPAEAHFYPERTWHSGAQVEPVFSEFFGPAFAKSAKRCVTRNCHASPNLINRGRCRMRAALEANSGEEDHHGRRNQGDLTSSV